MPIHILKCRKNQENKGVKECRFNSSHILPICEIKVHIILVDFKRSRNSFFVSFYSHTKPLVLIVQSSKTFSNIDLKNCHNQVLPQQPVDIAL